MVESVEYMDLLRGETDWCGFSPIEKDPGTHRLGRVERTAAAQRTGCDLVGHSLFDGVAARRLRAWLGQI